MTSTRSRSTAASPSTARPSTAGPSTASPSTAGPSTAGRATALADHPFLSALPAEALRRLAAHTYPHDYAAGDVIFREGEVADRFFLLRDGSVGLAMEVAGRGSVAMETLDADCALGWSWLFEPFTWQLTATAIEPTAMLVFDAQVLRTLMAADTVIGYELMRRFAGVMLDRLEATRSRLGAAQAEVPAAGVSGPWAGKTSNLQHV